MRPNLTLPTLVLSLLTAAALVSCARRESTDTTSMNTPPADTAAQAAMMTDANIAAIVVTANTADIDNGKLAESKTKDRDVLAFARQMITDHTSMNDQASALATKLNLTPQDNETSLAMKASQDSLRSAMGALAGTDFDKTYVDGEVALHQQVLDALDQALIPNAQNAELKQLLTAGRQTIAAHLEHAQRVQTKLGGTASR